MSFAAIGIGVGVAGVAGGIAGSKMSADAQRDAADTNARNQAEINRQNLAFQRESRGSTGSALYPIYGRELEQELYRDIRGAYNETAPDRAGMNAAVSRWLATRDQARPFATGVFDGGLLRRAQANFAPVKSARISLTREATAKAWQQALAQIAAANARQGYSGDNLRTNWLKFMANRDMGDKLAAANLANLNEERALADRYGIELPLSNLTLPGQMAQQDVQLEMMPDAAYINAMLKRAELLKPIYMGPGTAFRADPLPTVQPIASTGQLVAQGLGSAATTGLDMWLKQKQANELTAAIDRAGANHYQNYGQYTNPHNQWG